MNSLDRIPDIFELLDIETREDTYSRLLVHLLRHSVGLRRRVLEHAFGPEHPPAEPAEVDLRYGLPNPAGIVDIFLRNSDSSTGRWAMFIESKLYTGEHGEQTKRYWNACKALAGPNGRSAGIFLTIGGDRPVCPHVVPLTHRELTTWIAEHLSDIPERSAMHFAAEGYITRAQAPLPQATDETRYGVLLEQSWGLVPRLAGVSALGAAMYAGMPGEWSHNAIWIQGKGHANPGLQFWQPGWWGPELTGDRWTPENINVHLEMELNDQATWRLKLHFETEPYHTLGEIDELHNAAGFARMRDAFRAALHARAADLPGWKMSSYPLQIAAFPVYVPDPTVAHLREVLAPAMAAIAPHVHEALASARKAAQ
jgi:hypothetical protein